MEPIDYENATAWLVADDDSGLGTGFDASDRWQDETWILTAMYENPNFPEHITHTDVRKAQKASSETPIIVDGVSLDDLEPEFPYDGSSLRIEPPTNPKWRRLRWHELAARHGIDLQSPRPRRPFWWFGEIPSPARIRGPGEGCMDREQFNAMVTTLIDSASEGRDTPCIAFHPLLMTNDWETPMAFSMSLGELAGHYDREGVRGAPSNIWPIDRSWMVWTYYDDPATRISGSRDLIAAIRRDPTLETLDIPRTDGI